MHGVRLARSSCCLTHRWRSRECGFTPLQTVGADHASAHRCFHPKKAARGPMPISFSKRRADWVKESRMNGEISLKDQIFSGGERIKLNLVYDHDRVEVKKSEYGCLIVAGPIVQCPA